MENNIVAHRLNLDNVIQLKKSFFPRDLGQDFRCRPIVLGRTELFLGPLDRSAKACQRNRFNEIVDDSVFKSGNRMAREGGDGNDTLVLNGLASNYTIRYDSATQSYSIEAKSGSEGKDTFKTIEFLKFSDKTITPQSVNLVPPTITISSNLSSLGIGKTSTISFTISESVSDFVLGDVAVTGGALSNFTGSAKAYAATFTPELNFTGTASIKVASGKFTDSAGNTNEDGAEANNNLPIAIDTQQQK